MVEWLSIWVEAFFVNEFSKYKFWKEDLGKEPKSMDRCYCEFRNTKNIDQYKKFVEKNMASYEKLKFLLAYYDMNYGFDRFQKKTISQLLNPVLNTFEFTEDEKELLGSKVNFFYFHLDFFICWFSRKVENINLLYDVYAKILQSGKIDSLFILYYMLSKKIKRFGQDKDLKNKESIEYRLARINDLYPLAEEEYYSLLRDEGSPYRNSFLVGAFAVSVVGVGIGIASTFLKNKREESD